MVFKDLMKPLNPQSFLIGAGIAAAAYLIGPQLKEALRPGANKGGQGLMNIGEKTRQLFEEGKEKLNDIIFVKPEESVKMAAGEVGEALIRELREEREHTNKIMEELKNTLGGLKDEIASLRNNGMAHQG